MSEAYLIAAANGQINTGYPRAELVKSVIQSLLQKSNVPARRVQEAHWHESSANLLEPGLGSRLQELDFSPDLVTLQWPSTPLLVHYTLQAAVRAVTAGERDLIIISQFGQVGHLTQDLAVSLLLASPKAVGRHNVVPRARFSACLTLNMRAENFYENVRAGLEKKRAHDVEEAEEQPEVKVDWLAAARKLDGSPEKVFPGAQWLPTEDAASSGELFLLHALVEKLSETSAAGGLLVSSGPQSAGLVTLVEPV
jgi:hypothetical protein